MQQGSRDVVLAVPSGVVRAAQGADEVRTRGAREFPPPLGVCAATDSAQKNLRTELSSMQSSTRTQVSALRAETDALREETCSQLACIQAETAAELAVIRDEQAAQDTVSPDYPSAGADD